MKQEVWVFLRGLGRDSRHWGKFPQEFEQKNRKVLCLDLPGAGDRFEEQSPVSIRLMTAAIRREFLLLKKDFPDADFYLMAQSLGGMIALDWVSRHRDFKGLVLVNTSVAGVSPVYHRLLPSAALRLVRIVRERDPVKREMEVLKMISNNTSLHASVASEWADIVRERPVSVKNFASQLLAAATFSPPKTKPKIPVLVLSSKKDKMVSSKCSERLAAKWELPHLQHETAGHDLVIDDPQWVIATINAWNI
jgi:pimeloyl-ACP methyl ester carboxylesterase